MGKIKQLLWVYRTEILTIVILCLTVFAAFQLGRLSILYSGPSDFRIIDAESL